MLVNPLQWSLTRLGLLTQPVSYRALSSTAAVVVSGQPSICTVTCASVGVGVTYQQIVSYADPPAGSNDYRIAVTYEARQGF